MDWQAISTISGVAAPLAAIGLGYVNRSWIGRIFVPKIALASENYHLKEQVSELKRVNESLLASSAGWKSAAESSAFSQDQVEGLLDRITSLETYIPKFNMAMTHIEVLDKYIVLLMELLNSNHIRIPGDKPKLPAELSKDRLVP